MSEKKDLSKIEQIRIQLEKRILEIEKNKRISTSKIETDENISDEKSLFELRNELLSLNKSKKESKPKSKKPREIVKNNLLETKNKQKPTLVKTPEPPKEATTKFNNTISPINKTLEKSIKKPSSNTVNFQKKIAEKITKNIEQILKKERETPISKTVSVKQKNKIEPVSIKISKQVTENTNLSKNSNKQTELLGSKKVFIIIALIFAALFLGVLIKLKLDQQKTRELLEYQKQETIDYSKKDILFKDVEDDVEPDELQNIDQDNK